MKNVFLQWVIIFFKKSETFFVLLMSNKKNVLVNQFYGKLKC